MNQKWYLQERDSFFCKLNKKCLFLLLAFAVFGSLAGQTKVLSGTVRDSVSREPLPYVSVYYKGTTIGVMTDDKGGFQIELDPVDSLMVSCIGYKDYAYPVSKLKGGPLEILLAPSQYQLGEVTVNPGKERYTKKGNPAVEFVRKIIDNKDLKDPYSKDYYSFQRYKKILVALNDFDSTTQNNWMYRRFKFLKNYVDTSVISGKPILPLSVMEAVEGNYIRKSPESNRKIIEAYRKDGVDDFVSGDGMDHFFAETFKEIDIYNNDISLFLLRFVSPLSAIGPSFYKYYLNDTVIVDGVKCRDLSFVPMSSESLGFTGHMYVTLDSTYFVKKAVLNTPQKINLNFVDNMIIVQEYDRTPDSIRILKRDDMAVEFKLVGKKGGFYARRINLYRNESFSSPELSVFGEENPVIVKADSRNKDKLYWEKNRDTESAGNEDDVKNMLKDMRGIPLYYYSEKLLGIAIEGYIPTRRENSKFDIGPVTSMISGNSFEGARFRFGGMTTAALSKRWFTQGYLAYGTKDEKFKYKAQLEYSFLDKMLHEREFPVHSVRASYMYDVNQLGQQYGTIKDNVFLSLRRKSDDRIIYLRKAELDYMREFYSGLSFNIKLRNMTQYATRFVHFDKMLPDSSFNSLRSFRMTEAEFKIRYSPGEKFYQMKDKRIRITRDAPVFYLSHIIGVKGFLGSDYTMNRTEIGFDKRFWLSAFGSVNVFLNAGKVWNKVPFPLLIIPNTNLSYTIQQQSYSLMNAVEFINDEYVSWDVRYHMSGWLLNHVPLIKKLKLREIVSFKGMFGDLSKKNLPQNNDDLFVFPEGAYRMGRTPYMEASVGITNLLKLFRIEYVWRLTYRNHPNIDKSGIRVGLHVSF